MKKTVTIRRHPVVFVRNIFIAQFLAFVVYTSIAAIADYGPIYNDFMIARVISYETARLLFFAWMGGFVTVYVFSRWFFEFYNFSRGMIVHDYGIIFKNKTLFSLAAPLSVSYSLNPLGKLFHYGTIIVKSGRGDGLALKSISRPELHSSMIMERQERIGHEEEKITLSSVLHEEEHENLEFKSSLRWDIRLNKLNRDLEKSAMKTVAAFLNTSGGNLVLGIDDTKTVIGLAHDYGTLQKGNADGFQNHFTQVFNAMIGPEFRKYVRMHFDIHEGKDVCVVKVEESSKPVYVKNENEEAFFIRTGNGTTSLTLSEVERYIKSRWA